MTDRPMPEEERAEALEAAKRITGGWQRSLSQSGYWEETDPLTVARALLSTSAAAGGMREALEACHALIRRDYSDQRAAALEGHPIARDARDVWEKVCAVLSGIETEQAQARSPSALSASISHGNKAHDQ